MLVSNSRLYSLLIIRYFTLVDSFLELDPVLPESYIWGCLVTRKWPFITQLTLITVLLFLRFLNNPKGVHLQDPLVA